MCAWCRVHRVVDRTFNLARRLRIVFACQLVLAMLSVCAFFFARVKWLTSSDLQKCLTCQTSLFCDGVATEFDWILFWFHSIGPVCVCVCIRENQAYRFRSLFHVAHFFFAALSFSSPPTSAAVDSRFFFISSTHCSFSSTNVAV